MQFSKDEIATINKCLSIHHNDNTITYERATHDDIVLCVHNEYMNNDYHYDMITCDVHNDEMELIKYVEHMCDVARLHGRII